MPTPGNLSPCTLNRGKQPPLPLPLRAPAFLTGKRIGPLLAPGFCTSLILLSHVTFPSRLKNMAKSKGLLPTTRYLLPSQHVFSLLVFPSQPPPLRHFSKHHHGAWPCVPFLKCPLSTSRTKSEAQRDPAQHSSSQTRKDIGSALYLFKIDRLSSGCIFSCGRDWHTLRATICQRQLLGN